MNEDRIIISTPDPDSSNRWLLLILALMLAGLAISTGATATFLLLEGERMGPFLAVLFVLITAGATWALGVWNRPDRRRITVDLDRQTVTFEHLHVARSFWDLSWRPRPRFECALPDILSVHSCSFPAASWRQYIYVLTRHGTVTVPDGMTRLAEIRTILATASAHNPSGPVIHRPAFWVPLIVLMTLLGIALGWLIFLR